MKELVSHVVKRIGEKDYKIHWKYTKSTIPSLGFALVPLVIGASLLIKNYFSK